MATVGIGVKGLRTTQRKLKELPDDAKGELVKASGRIAKVVGDQAAMRFTALGNQGPLVGRTLRSTKGTVPTIKVGGSSKLGRNKAPAYKLLYGTEFGSDKYKQFHAAHTGRVGRALYPTVRDRAEYMYSQWKDAADKVARDFAEGGDGAEEAIV